VIKGEMSAKTTYQRSAKGPVSISECSADGTYVALENTGRKVIIRLSLCMIVWMDSGHPKCMQSLEFGELPSSNPTDYSVSVFREPNWQKVAYIRPIISECRPSGPIFSKFSGLVDM